MTSYLAGIAKNDRRWDDAERLQTLSVEWHRAQTADTLARLPERWSPAERNLIRALAVAAHELGQPQREVGNPACVDAYRECFVLVERAVDRVMQATSAFNIALAYKDLSSLRFLDEAERWCQESLKLRDSGDSLGRTKCLISLGSVSIERFDDALSRQCPEAGLRVYLNAALKFSRQAFDLLSEAAVDDMAAMHTQLGTVFARTSDIEHAVPHYRKAIDYREQQSNIYGAGHPSGRLRKLVGSLPLGVIPLH